MAWISDLLASMAPAWGCHCWLYCDGPWRSALACGKGRTRNPINHSLGLAGTRAPKIAEPTRTWVAPKVMALVKSPDMPIDSWPLRPLEECTSTPPRVGPKPDNRPQSCLRPLALSQPFDPLTRYSPEQTLVGSDPAPAPTVRRPWRVWGGQVCGCNRTTAARRAPCWIAAGQADAP